MPARPAAKEGSRYDGLISEVTVADANAVADGEKEARADPLLDASFDA